MQDIIAIIQAQEQKQDIGLAGSGNMKLKEFTDIDLDKKNDIGYDIVDDLKCHMRDDPMFYRKLYYPCMAQLKDSYDKGDHNFTGVAEMVEKAIHHYCKKYDLIQSPTELLTKEDKDALIQEIYNEELEEVKKGEY